MHDPCVGDRLPSAADFPCRFFPDQPFPDFSFPVFPEFDETILDTVAPKRPGPAFLRQSPPIAPSDGGDPACFRPERLDFRDKPINPPGPRRFNAVTTFAGCGGSSLGYKWAGGRVLAAVEWDKDAAAVYRRNHADTLVLERDIAAVSGAELLQTVGLEPGDLDVLDGSPPCQGYSIAGRRRLDDPRNRLFLEFGRLLREIRPKTFVMENVSGMVKGPHRRIFAEALAELKAAGYVVRAWLLDAMYFGVPQSRQRLIFVGVRQDLADRLGLTPACPAPFTAPIPFGAACGDLRGNGPGDRMLGPFLQRFREVQPPKWSTAHDAYAALKGTSGGSMSLQWALWERVCGTIVKSETAIAGIVHPDRERYLSLAEARRCASFPDAFEFTDRAKGIERIGNSVPPRFMEAIAETVYETLLRPVHLRPVHSAG